MLPEIYKEDYDADIETYTHPWDADEDSRKPAVIEECPKTGWDRVILPPEVKDSLALGIVQARFPQLFLDGLGLGRTIHTGRGVSMLFSGPPGTGKTLAARAVASELGKKLMVVSYSRLENLFVGETEKNIDQCFKDAAKHNAVLLFDEADAVFYMRSSLEQSHANRDVSVLLQAIERFEGVVILTTNSGKLLDPALERRMALKVVFPMPDAKARERIFRALAPAGAEKGMDFKALAEKFEFSGGQIKNVWLNAGRMAMKRTGGTAGTKITMAEMEEAARMEEKGAEAMETKLSSGSRKGYA
jgi:SpoVK/Ycf46/Vps4 family AAA+-type ATPase